MNIETLHKLFLKHPTVCTDTRKITKDCMFFALKGDNFNGNTFAKDALKKGATYAVVDKKDVVLNDSYILVDDVLKTLQELATYHRHYLGLKIIALTGSNGKTTTKELINAVLKKKYNTVATKGNLNNHIGVPITLLSINNKTEIGIVEMGANHLKEIEFLCNIAQPDYGYITNFGKAHLEGFGSVEGVIKGKSELYQYLKTNNKLIFVNANDTTQLKQLNKYQNSYSFGNNTSNCNIELLEANPFVVVKYNNTTIQSQLIGAYNFNNISAAITIGNYFKATTIDIKEAIESYIPENNRSQIINKSSNQIILDAYNANPTSMVAALDNFDQISATNKIAILGDMFELGEDTKIEHKHIADYANNININKVFLVGENFYNTEFNSAKVTLCKTFDDLKTHIQNLKPKETTLLVKGSRGMALERVLEFL
ncbi:UDP-N-acetylmuramoyl-tripeptide--D-alanyl-D-alanine ligase [Pontimicrobium aquaticum]|uniref:UDP-N-acetylmuramoyl-tripeptide--D-alanyl-D-alanine ligase n=1 Tax=Pontimicrobium aquaticum TaxID=2565367 RepID=A0A4U0EXD9_9FLAO|nr:UDP-N-acetylmuramoyl-tripeptide--D-alanyl-D-alanine ligase [Pontimicrobium aquaticum]TJY36530.1 UDP-N-acetylmuramoyl-tripeptide--D-alanyl-D-alanine ligase [Pontimicrobium aquaticum]